MQPPELFWNPSPKALSVAYLELSTPKPSAVGHQRTTGSKYGGHALNMEVLAFPVQELAGSVVG